MTLKNYDDSRGNIIINLLKYNYRTVGNRCPDFGTCSSEHGFCGVFEKATVSVTFTNPKYDHKLFNELQPCNYNCFVWADMSATNRILAIKAKKRCCCQRV